MDSSNKEVQAKNESKVNNNYNPWNVFFNSRQRTNSENSVTSNCSFTSTESGSQFGTVQKQNTKTEDYLWMIWRS
ncbi:unnamed protein product [Pieris brassicae]|uniref:Uncharacterized protein n=1 Tax=Pieris brassicae TaxID=7116 RepID=A0A9P0TF95_PIEBR|nr:unnamed protein product [Pieris brassicae]